MTTIEGSSSISAYEFKDGVLSIKFQKSKEIYDFQNIPPEIVTGFEEAESKGSFFHSMIKGTYQFTKRSAE